MRASANGSVPQPWKAQLERKLAQGAGLALSDCFVGLRVMCALYFGISVLLLASIPIDWLCGTSLTGIWANWYVQIKLTVLAAALLWCVFLLAPAVACASLLNAKPEKSSWRARPIIGALALNAMLFVGYEVWHHIPPRPPRHPNLLCHGRTYMGRGSQFSSLNSWLPGAWRMLRLPIAAGRISFAFRRGFSSNCSTRCPAPPTHL